MYVLKKVRKYIFKNYVCFYNSKHIFKNANRFIKNLMKIKKCFYFQNYERLICFFQKRKVKLYIYSIAL